MLTRVVSCRQSDASSGDDPGSIPLDNRASSSDDCNDNDETSETLCDGACEDTDEIIDAGDDVSNNDDRDTVLNSVEFDNDNGSYDIGDARSGALAAAVAALDSTSHYDTVRLCLGDELCIKGPFVVDTHFVMSLFAESITHVCSIFGPQAKSGINRHSVVGRTPCSF